MSVRHALLALLSESPRYGLQLHQEFESRTGETWPLNIGQVYTTLQRLERDGLVESDETVEGRQKDFSITPAGGTELRRWLETPSDILAPPRDELLIKVLIGLSVPDIDIRSLLQVHRRHLIERMQHYTHVKSDADEDAVALPLVADFELFRLDGVIRWLDAVDARLARSASGPAESASAATRKPVDEPEQPDSEEPR